MNMKQVQAIILAGGKGTRMNANESRNKVMFEIGGKPIISYPVQLLKSIGILKPIIVVGYAKESIMNYLGDSVEYAIQENPVGTGDAVKCALPLISPETKYVIVLYGDHSTFYTPKVLTDLLSHEEATQAALTLITTHTDPKGYGRVLRDNMGKMIGIVEEKNATEEQRAITEINTGNGVFLATILQKFLPEITPNELTKEYYFPDVIELCVKNGLPVETLVVEDSAVAIGVNTQEQLQAAEEELLRRTIA